MRPQARTIATILFVAALSVILWTQRALLADALREIGSLSAVALILLLALGTYERWSRADIVRRLLPAGVGWRTAFTVHDTGNAASKGVPMGGAIGTAVRWSVCRDAGIPAPKLASMLVNYGIATTTATWSLALAATAIDLPGRAVGWFDLGIIVITTIALIGFWSTLWYAVHSERAMHSTHGIVGRAWERIGARFTSCRDHDPCAAVDGIRSDVAAFVRRPFGLLGRTLASQACGAVILLVALRSLGAGAELGTTEFLRIFFLTHLLGTFAPTPGGVGVVEAGMTGALVAAGVEAPIALASVIVYRLVVHFTPIVVGVALLALWRLRPPATRQVALDAAGHVDDPVDSMIGPVLPLPAPSARTAAVSALPVEPVASLPASA